MLTIRFLDFMFLMYRVELKVLWQKDNAFSDLCQVPNVPCGVESCNIQHHQDFLLQFLMYRVELKVRFVANHTHAAPPGS